MQEIRDYQSKLLIKSLALAETNRNLHIEQRRAASKKILEKAKKVVLQNQRRAQEEQERRRVELENRIKKTEARRLAHLNRYKKESTMSAILKIFRGLGLPSASQKDTWLGFNSIGQLIHLPEVIMVTSKILNLALEPDAHQKRRTRIFLTSYIVMMCPRDIFEFQGEQEQTLHESSRHLLLVFESWLINSHGRLGKRRDEFAKAWYDYTAQFNEWKTKDRDELVKSTIAYYVQLSTLRQKMIAHQNGDRSIGEQLQNQLDQIKKKLKKLGGQDALTSLDFALQTCAGSTSTGRRQQEEKATPRTPGIREASQDEMDHVLSGYGSSVSANMQLAHEIVLNPDFSLDNYITPLETQVKNIAEKAFFDILQQDIERGEINYKLIQDIKQRLLSLAQRQDGLKERIEQEIDLELIQQQMNKKVFDMTSMMQYVLDRLSDMCAPVRDEEIMAIRIIQNSFEQLKRLFRLLNTMDLDVANFHLRSLRAPLMEISVEYERAKFAELLNNESIQLVTTRAWLDQSCQRLNQVAVSRNPEKVSMALPSHDAILDEALVSLIHQQEILTASGLPETLCLDVRRMAEFQNEFQAITMVAALLMLARNFGRASPGLATKLFTMLQDTSTSIDHLAVEIERTVDGDVRQERRDMIRNMVDKTLSHSDTVYSLLSRRVALVIKNTIQNRRCVSEAVITSNGLEHVCNNLQSLAQRILKLADHHRKVYAPWYDKIIREILDQ